MPKDLQERHDAAAETTRYMRVELDREKHRKYNEKLRKMYAFEYEEGDILLKPGSHVVMVLDDGAKAAEEQVVHNPDIVTVYYSVRLPLLVKGMKGDAVKAMQQILLARGYKLPRYGACGEFNEETENALLLFQEDMNLEPDAKCGPKTWSALLGLTGVG